MRAAGKPGEPVDWSRPRARVKKPYRIGFCGRGPKPGCQQTTADPIRSLATTWSGKAPPTKPVSNSGAGATSWWYEPKPTNSRLVEVAGARGTNAPTNFIENSGVADAPMFPQHVYASLPMRKKRRTEAQSIVDSIPADGEVEAWRRFAQRFDPASAQAMFIIMINVLNSRQRQYGMPH